MKIHMCVCVCVCTLVAQSCLTLCDPTDCSLVGSSVHGILQARILECVAIYFSRGSCPLRDPTHVSCISCTGRRVLYQWATGEALNNESTSGETSVLGKPELLVTPPGRTQNDFRWPAFYWESLLSVLLCLFTSLSCQSAFYQRDCWLQTQAFCKPQLLLSCQDVSNSLWPHGLQHASLTCPSLSPGAYSNSRPLSGWCHPTISSSVALPPPSVFPSIRIFSNESALCIRWPKYWSFSFNISPSSEYSGLISFRIDWLDLLAGHSISL